MYKNLILFLTFSFVLITGCATTPTDDIKIDSEVDPKVNFSSFSTYSWLGSAELLVDPEGKWKQPDFDVDTEIRSLINRELGKHGMSETTNNPDVIVAYAMGVDMAALKIKENPEAKELTIKEVPKGALLVFLVNPVTDYIMWMGQATAQVQQNPNSEVAKKRLDYAVTNMLAKLPK